MEERLNAIGEDMSEVVNSIPGYGWAIIVGAIIAILLWSIITIERGR